MRKAVLAKLRGLVGGSITVIDGAMQTRLGDPSTDLHAVITVHHPSFYRALALRGSMGAGESYRDGYWTCDDLVALIQIFAQNMQASSDLGGAWNALFDLGHQVVHRFKRNTRAGSRRNIAAHYDLSNEFYSLFLDETMTYSSGVFPDEGSSMKDASIEKYDRICRKLRLVPSDHVIEIGTGWGGFAEHAVRHYGCRVTTTTISKQQHDYAQQRFAAAGVEGHVSLLLSDYRDLSGQYDKLVSIEMIEAVGHEYLDTFFAKCSRLLKPDGLAAIQAITIPDQRYEQYRRSVDFIQKYIFPGGCLPSLARHDDVGRSSHRPAVRSSRRFRGALRANAAMLAGIFSREFRCDSYSWHDRTLPAIVGLLLLLLRRSIPREANWCVSNVAAEARQSTKRSVSFLRMIP